MSEDLDSILELADRVAVTAGGTINYHALVGEADHATIASTSGGRLQEVCMMRPFDVTRILGIVGLVLGFLCWEPAGLCAQDWPNKPVKIIAPFAAGGAADTLGRIIADHFSTAFHQQFYVENRGGAGGIIGAAAGATAEPDGYTLVVSSIASNVISPVFNANPGYDGLRDFTHIAYLGGPPAVVIVHPSWGVTNFQDFVAAARKSKEPINYISPGTGSNGFLVAEYLARQEGYKITHIPYKGAGPALTDLLAGHVKLGTITFSSAAEQIRAGRVRALAVTSEKRIPDFADIPTLKEMGIDLVAATWFGLSGPPRLPSDIVQALSRETLRTLQIPEVQKRLALDAIETRLMSPEQFTKFVEDETKRWAPLARSFSGVIEK